MPLHSPSVARATFAARWDRTVAEHAEREFLIFESNAGRISRFSYAEFAEVVRRTEIGLASRGVEAGSVVHLVLPNSVAFVALWLACARLGAVFSSSDPRASTAELAAVRRRLRPVLSVIGEQQSASYPAPDGAFGGPVLVTGAEDPTIGGLADPAYDGSGDPGQPPGREPATSPEPGDVLAVLFTSGTTSAPKGVQLTQALYAHTAEVMARAAGLTATDRWLVVLPLFHANAQYYCFASAISVGASVALMSAFSARRFLDQARRHRVTHTSLFAAPIRMVLARGGSTALASPLRHVWFAQNLTDGEYERFSALVGVAPRQLYGMTETGPAVLTSPAGSAQHRSMGRVTPGCAVRIRALSGDRPAADGEVGVLEVHGVPGHTLFDGYLADPDTTRAGWSDVEADGSVWFATGDRVRVDPDGDHHFAGRGGDQLKVAGENVSVVEIEELIATHPGVFEVAVVGRPDPIRTEVPVAYVVPADPSGADGPAGAGLVDAIEALCVAQLSPSKRPHEVILVEELPRTSVGKIRKFLLGRQPSTDVYDDATASSANDGQEVAQP